MGNAGSTVNGTGNSVSGGGGGRRRHSGHHHQPAPPPPADVSAPNRYVFAAATPYAPQYPNTNPPQYYSPTAQYGNYYPPAAAAMPVPLPAPYDHHHPRVSGPAPVGAEFAMGPHHHPGWTSAPGRYPPCVPPPLMPAPYVEHQKAVTIRNDVNLKKETLRVEPDEADPGKFLVAFSFDATIAGSMTIYFFAREEYDCNLTATKENLLKPITVSFKEGLAQKFRQPSGTGIDFSAFEESGLLKECETDVYPLAVQAEATASIDQVEGENQKKRTLNSQITQAMFEKKDNGDYQVRVVKQILWVNETRYELQEIYGIGNSVEGDADGNDPGKECVICLSEPRDTTVLPCRHMCMCSECAKVLRFQTNRCPICRQPVERLLEIKVNNKGEEQQQQQEL